MNDTFTKEQVLNAYNSAPDFVRIAFNDEKTTQVVVDLRARFQLHIDRAGILGKEVGYLLLGLTDPSKFVNRLKSNNFPDQMVDAIVTEINQKIFMPIREQMKSKSRSAPAPVTAQPARPVNAGVPRYVPPATVLSPQKSYSPPPQSPRYANQQDDASVNAFVHRVEPRPAAPSVSVITPPPAPPAPQRPPQPPPAARPMPPPNLPGAVPPKSDIVPPTPKAPPPPSSLDPYREPL